MINKPTELEQSVDISALAEDALWGYAEGILQKGLPKEGIDRDVMKSVICQAIQKAITQKDQEINRLKGEVERLIKELCRLAKESREREMALTRLEFEVKTQLKRKDS